MRKDIFEYMKRLQLDGIAPNYAEIARRYGCDYRTAKRYFEHDPDTPEIKRKPIPSKLDPYREIIQDKLQDACNHFAIFKFIQKKGYRGKYTILNDYCNSIVENENKKATIRFETNPGLQAQVDWKEDFSLKSRSGEIFTVNIFLMLLGYSRKKYLELTLDRNQDTVMKCMINGFHDFGGVPKEILFDNMKTVVDHSKTDYRKAVINDKFYQFSRDMGFEVLACRAYRPQTKGKVEALARTCERLMVYNGEFDTIEELSEIVDDFKNELNSEISQATGKIPDNELGKEKEYFHPLPNQDILDTYLTTPLIRKVSKESMIVFNKQKYSLPTNYIGKNVELKVEGQKLSIFYEKHLIATHNISERKYNYQEEHLVQILRSDAMKHATEDDIEAFAKERMKIYDRLEA